MAVVLSAFGILDKAVNVTTEYPVCVLAALILLHVVLHCCAPHLIRLFLWQAGLPGLARTVDDRYHVLSAEAQRALNRLVRSHIYYVIAGPLGAYLLYGHLTWDLAVVMRGYTPLHGAAFLLAISHWIVALVEDALTPNFFDTVVTMQEGPHVRFSRYHLYLLHHLVAALAFGFCLWTRALPAMGACGLLFELPVAFVNARDLLRDFDRELRWFRPLGGWFTLDLLWMGTFLTMIPGRFAPMGLLIWTVCHWRQAVAVAAPWETQSHARSSALPVRPVLRAPPTPLASCACVCVRQVGDGRAAFLRHLLLGALVRVGRLRVDGVGAGLYRGAPRGRRGGRRGRRARVDGRGR